MLPSSKPADAPPHSSSESPSQKEHNFLRCVKACIDVFPRALKKFFKKTVCLLPSAWTSKSHLGILKEIERRSSHGDLFRRTRHTHRDGFLVESAACQAIAGARGSLKQSVLDTPAWGSVLEWTGRYLRSSARGDERRLGSDLWFSCRGGCPPGAHLHFRDVLKTCLMEQSDVPHAFEGYLLKRHISTIRELRNFVIHRTEWALDGRISRNFFRIAREVLADFEGSKTQPKRLFAGAYTFSFQQELRQLSEISGLTIQSEQQATITMMILSVLRREAGQLQDFIRMEKERRRKKEDERQERTRLDRLNTVRLNFLLGCMYGLIFRIRLQWEHLTGALRGPMVQWVYLPSIISTFRMIGGGKNKYLLDLLTSGLTEHAAPRDLKEVITRLKTEQKDPIPKLRKRRPRPLFPKDANVIPIDLTSPDLPRYLECPIMQFGEIGELILPREGMKKLGGVFGMGAAAILHGLPSIDPLLKSKSKSKGASSRLSLPERILKEGNCWNRGRVEMKSLFDDSVVLKEIMSQKSPKQFLQPPCLFVFFGALMSRWKDAYSPHLRGVQRALLLFFGDEFNPGRLGVQELVAKVKFLRLKSIANLEEVFVRDYFSKSSTPSKVFSPSWSLDDGREEEGEGEVEDDDLTEQDLDQSHFDRRCVCSEGLFEVINAGLSPEEASAIAKNFKTFHQRHKAIEGAEEGGEDAVAVPSASVTATRIEKEKASPVMTAPASAEAPPAAAKPSQKKKKGQRNKKKNKKKWKRR